MNIPWELILTVTLSALGGALIPAIGLWLQSRQSKRELSLRHEEILYQRRLELALEISKTSYDYMAVSHRLKSEKDEHLRKAYYLQLFELGKQIQAHESQAVLLFPSESVAAFRKYWRLVDEIRTSQEIHWTSVGSRLDETYAELTNSMRYDLGVESVGKQADSNIWREPQWHITTQCSQPTASRFLRCSLVGDSVACRKVAAAVGG